MDIQKAERFAADLDLAIDQQQGDHSRTGEAALTITLLYIAKAIMHAADKIDDCACCLSHMVPREYMKREGD